MIVVRFTQIERNTCSKCIKDHWTNAKVQRRSHRIFVGEKCYPAFSREIPMIERILHNVKLRKRKPTAHPN